MVDQSIIADRLIRHEPSGDHNPLHTYPKKNRGEYSLQVNSRKGGARRRGQNKPTKLETLKGKKKKSICELATIKKKHARFVDYQQ